MTAHACEWNAAGHVACSCSWVSPDPGTVGQHQAREHRARRAAIDVACVNVATALGELLAFADELPDDDVMALEWAKTLVARLPGDLEIRDSLR